MSQEEAGEVGVVTKGDSAAQVGVTGGLMNTESFIIRRSGKEQAPDDVCKKFVHF